VLTIIIPGFKLDISNIIRKS